MNTSLLPTPKANFRPKGTYLDFTYLRQDESRKEVSEFLFGKGLSRSWIQSMVQTDGELQVVSLVSLLMEVSQGNLPAAQTQAVAILMKCRVVLFLSMVPRGN